jgi:histone H3/H4
MGIKILFEKNQKRYQKTQNFTLISNPLKKLLKNAPKKVISKTSLTHMSKNEKSAYFRHIFDNNFFLVHFFKPFSTDSKLA